MRPLVFASLAWLVSSTCSFANETSDRLLALAEQQRNEAWTAILKRHGKKCDAVDRTMFRRITDIGFASWTIGCRDKNDYLVGISPGSYGTADYVIYGCTELNALTAMLAQMRGEAPAKDSIDCWQNR